MSNQEKKSFNQIFKGEVKLIALFTFIIAVIPVISEFIMISDINGFRNLTIIQQLATLIGKYEYSLTDLTIFTISGLIVSAISIPFIAAIMAHRLNGEQPSQAINSGLREIKSKRFWNFNLKVYLPYIIVVAIIIIIMMFIPESTVLSIMASIVESTLLQVIVIILLAVISIVVSTISGALFVTNIAYMRGANHIRDVLEFIPGREINKLFIFNLSELLAMGLIILSFVVPIMFMTPVSLLQNILSILIGFIVVLIIFQICFLYLRFSLYMNIGSKIEPQDSRSKHNQSKASMAVNHSQVVEVEVLDSDSVSDPFELSIRPKSHRRKDRFKNNTDIKNKKVKRSIK